MANISVTELSYFINQQANIHEQLALQLRQVQALAEVTVAWVEFLDNPETAQGLLECLHDRIQSIVELHQDLHEAVLSLNQKQTIGQLGSD